MAAVLPVIAVLYRVTAFADGSFFALSILTADPWSFGWVSYPSRITAFGLTILPPFTVGRITNDPALAVATYSAIMGALPLAGLLATQRLSAPGAPWPTLCAASTIVLAFNVAFFPTEMWLAHALVWPLVALAARPGAPLAAVAILALATAFVHEAAIPLVGLALVHGALTARRPALLAILAAVLAVALLVKALAPIANDEIARTVGQNALDFLSPGNFFTNGVVSVLGALGLWAAVRVVYRPASARGEIMIVMGVCLAAAIQLLVWPGPPHVLRRYIARSLIFVGLAATLGAAIALQVLPGLATRIAAWRDRHIQPLLAAAAVIILVSALGHLTETARFLGHWQRLEQALSGAVPAAEAMPRGMVAFTADGREVMGTAAWALPTGGTLEVPNPAPDGAGPFGQARPYQPGPGWAVAWHWALPLHSVAPAQAGGADFIVAVPAADFSPVTCNTLRALDPATTLVPPVRLALLTRYICAREARRLTPPPG
jgi:hypothetical protein